MPPSKVPASTASKFHSFEPPISIFRVGEQKLSELVPVELFTQFAVAKQPVVDVFKKIRKLAENLLESDARRIVVPLLFGAARGSIFPCEVQTGKRLLQSVV